MIPSDLAARLRVMMESAVHPLAAAREIASDLPDLRPGQRFTASIQNALPDGTYRAVVAGKSMTLALPQGAKAGDSLDLIAVGNTGRSVLATEAAPAAGPSGAALPGATLSRAAKLIGNLLARDGDAPPRPTSLARGAPLLAQPADSGKPLAPLLQSAVARSGLFYEAHQAQWISGRLATEVLLREPQARHLPAATGAAAHQPETAEPASRLAPMSLDAPPHRATGAVGIGETSGNALLLSRAATELESAALTTSKEALQIRDAAPALPEEIAPLVRQQLDALANQHVVLLGQLWPGQYVEWEIEDAGRERAANDAADEPQPWTTSLRLELPNLGQLGATLTLDSRGVAIRLRSNDEKSADALRSGATDLVRGLGDAGINLVAMEVENDCPE